MQELIEQKIFTVMQIQYLTKTLKQYKKDLKRIEKEMKIIAAQTDGA